MEKDTCECKDSSCGNAKVRESLNVFSTEAEAVEFRIIRTRIQCAAQAMQIQALPKGVTPADVQLFITAAIESKADSMVMEAVWWENNLTKYNLKDKGFGDVYFDAERKEFYIMRG
jgi:hypothetical protein